MSKTITLSCTKAVIFEAYTKACERELQALRDLEDQRLATSIAEGHAALVAPVVPPAQVVAAEEDYSLRKGYRQFFRGDGQLMERIPFGFNQAVVRPVLGVPA